MQIHKFPIAGLKKDELLQSMQITDRWKDAFEIDQDGIVLKIFPDVEKLIDLFTERYTGSLLIPGQEYNTEVKDSA